MYVAQHDHHICRPQPADLTGDLERFQVRGQALQVNQPAVAAPAPRPFLCELRASKRCACQSCPQFVVTNMSHFRSRVAKPFVTCVPFRGFPGHARHSSVEPACTFSKKQRTKRKRILTCQGASGSSHGSQDPDKEDSRASSKPPGEDDQPEDVDTTESAAAEPQNVDWRQFRWEPQDAEHVCHHSGCCCPLC